VGRHGDRVGPVGDGQAGELEALVHALGPVVDAGQEMEVELGPHVAP